MLPGVDVRGRGALSNAAGRYERHSHHAVADGWDIPHEGGVLRTEVSVERPRKIITRNTSPDVPFDRSLNPYRGCEHGCIYCFARPTHAWLGYSPGVDFETKLIARPMAAKVLEGELRARSYKPDVLAIGTNTDPYQPIEGRYRVMREVLEVLEAFNHPVSIVTKGTGIERDIDILGRMAAKGLASVGVSVTTLGSAMSRKMEPRVPGPARRLQTIKRLAEAGIPVRVMASPLIPGLTGHELEAILSAGANAGAKSASYIMLRLPREVAPLFTEWLTTHFPDRAGKVMRQVRELHGGRDYDPTFGKRFTGEGDLAELMAQRFTLACKRLGLKTEPAALRTDLFAAPVDGAQQLSLF